MKECGGSEGRASLLTEYEEEIYLMREFRVGLLGQLALNYIPQQQNTLVSADCNYSHDGSMVTCS